MMNNWHSAGMIGSLRAGKGIFGEKTTMSFSKAVLKTAGLDVKKAEQETESEAEAAPSKAAAAPGYTDTDKWTVTVTGPMGVPMEVTVRPNQKAGLLLKAWMAENEVESGYKLQGSFDKDTEIGQTGLADGGNIKIVAV
jgi:hypothetical protein